jgi:hypothetical protein
MELVAHAAGINRTVIAITNPMRIGEYIADLPSRDLRRADGDFEEQGTCHGNAGGP